MADANVLKELIQFCETKKLAEVAEGIKQQLASKETAKQVDTLKIIKDALIKEDRRSTLEAQKGSGRGKEPLK